MTVTLDTIDSAVSLFQTAVNQLYEDIENWLQGMPLQTRRLDIQIDEAELDPYTIPSLIIVHQTNTGDEDIAELTPVGCNIFGAEYRLDMSGIITRQILVYFKPPGPVFTSLITGEPVTEILYPNIKQHGWYLIERKLDGEAHIIDKTVFLHLLSRVSSYDRIK